MSGFEVKYIGPEDFVHIVDTIQAFDYPHRDEVPDYDSEPEAVDNYFSLIDRTRSDAFYSTVYLKATVLFLNINGHYFSNGNKRLAIFSLTYFLELNNIKPKELSKESYSSLLQSIFKSDIALTDYEGFEASDFAMYNLAIITAQFNKDGIDFDLAKELTESFIREIYY